MSSKKRKRNADNNSNAKVTKRSSRVEVGEREFRKGDLVDCEKRRSTVRFEAYIVNITDDGNLVVESTTDNARTSGYVPKDVKLVWAVEEMTDSISSPTNLSTSSRGIASRRDSPDADVVVDRVES